MSRNILHEEDGPYIVDEDEFEEQGGNIAICQCGLSSNKPFCDGSHQSCADEDADEVYEYDAEGGRRVAEDD